MAAVRPLLKASNAIEQQVDDLDRKVMRLARNAQVQRFMTAPGVGPITAALASLRRSTPPLASRGREALEPMPD